MRRIVLLGVLLIVSATQPALGQAPTPAYLVMGDSIEFGLGDDIPGDGMGYVPLVAAFLAGVLGQPPEVHNFGEPFARTHEIRRTQLPAIIAAAAGHFPVVVSWGGGGNDLAEVVTGPQAAACRQVQSCLGRLNGLMNEVEQRIDRTIRELRGSLGPNAIILMRTMYNALARTGCQSPENVALGNVALEGADGTVLDRGLNDRIRSVAAKYDAQVVELFLPFAVNANTLVATDCIHPSGAGHQVIANITGTAFVAAQ